MVLNAKNNNATLKAMEVGDIVFIEGGTCVGTIISVVKNREEMRSSGLGERGVLISTTFPYDENDCIFIGYPDAALRDEGAMILTSVEIDFINALMGAAKSKCAPPCSTCKFSFKFHYEDHKIAFWEVLLFDNKNYIGSVCFSAKNFDAIYKPNASVLSPPWIPVEGGGVDEVG